MKKEGNWIKILMVLELVLIILMAIIMNIGLDVRAEPQNDTWKDSHWGGDTGEENYTEPTDGIIIPDNDICTPSYCAGILVMVAIPVAMVVQKRRKDIEKIQNGKSK